MGESALWIYAVASSLLVLFGIDCVRVEAMRYAKRNDARTRAGVADGKSHEESGSAGHAPAQRDEID
jgi:hypothetical protein